MASELDFETLLKLDAYHTQIKPPSFPKKLKSISTPKIKGAINLTQKNAIKPHEKILADM